ncbi:hypothetical protein SUDANB1_00445 [Streptomyces sp. enrichment culture]|uniref:hypothetical protein n=1 Tax=Streptomyces sp. enrichment culture TaxID=1795815 RepID=UPI003F55FA83
MGFLDRLVARDQRLAASDTRESATNRAARQRRQGHRRNLTQTAREGQAWEDRDRQQDRKGRWYRAAR